MKDVKEMMEEETRIPRHKQLLTFYYDTKLEDLKSVFDDYPIRMNSTLMLVDKRPDWGCRPVMAQIFLKLSRGKH